MIERIETRRLVLRPMTMDDVDALVELDSDPEVMRYLTGGRPRSRREVIAIVRLRLGARWMAYETATGVFVGWFGLEPQGDDEYDVGYRLRRVMWRNGYATEGARALVDAAFEVLGARRITAQTMAVNVRSRLVMRHCGLRYARTFHRDWDEPIDGVEYGEVEYELLRADWERAQASETP
jgi:RimJ/RimL family protein N-acetyltransferase